MYTVTLETIKKGQKQGSVQRFELGEMDTPAYNKQMKELSDVLFELDVEFDDIEGDGDMVIDDLMISIAEEEPFEKVVTGKKEKYIVKGEASA